MSLHFSYGRIRELWWTPQDDDPVRMRSRGQNRQDFFDSSTQVSWEWSLSVRDDWALFPSVADSCSGPTAAFLTNKVPLQWKPLVLLTCSSSIFLMMEETWRKLRFKLYFWVFCLLKALGVEEKNVIKKKRAYLLHKRCVGQATRSFKKKKILLSSFRDVFSLPPDFQTDTLWRSVHRTTGPL